MVEQPGYVSASGLSQATAAVGFSYTRSCLLADVPSSLQDLTQGHWIQI